MPWSPIPCESTEKGRAVGRVDHEVRLVDVDLDRAHADRDAADDRGHRFGVGDDVGVERVDVEGDPDDDGAVVVGPGEGRGDRDQAESGAPLKGPAMIDLADRVEGVGAGAGGDVGGADFRARPGSSGWPARLRPGVLRRGGDRGLRAVGDAAQVGGQARRHGEVELAEELVAVFAVELQGEGAERRRRSGWRCRRRGSG